MNRKTLMASSVAAALAVPAAVQADVLNIDFYGSARVQVESVRPDNRDQLDTYTGVRDAYSRIGFTASYPLLQGLNLIGQLELPLDIANKAVQDPWDQDQDIRVAQIGIQGDMGTLVYGQMWLPYYNAIAYPVDMFSTYYSGFATYTAFRRGDTIGYYSPDMHGLSFAFAWSEDHGADGDNRVQLTGSYAFGDTTLSIGMDDLNGDDNMRIVGVSAAHTMGNLYLGAKVERFYSDIDDDAAYGNDGDMAMNVYAGYTLGKNTFKLMVAEVDNYGETIVHVGMDHQFNPALKLFAEYYYEQETAAITQKRGGMNETAWAASGGEVFAVGMRFDF
ncbi:Outer membrane protein (porin) [Ectothiorhodospira magna]|uniref:Outer membrane protein (Porin) n=1 Tax=Ectothiorhodospira magna TaxID=867345 RepID=A0A1H9C6H9_9GAMM|nr:porin [Ectothiorhodospira magna]SEP96453.1 Outer membrane protein (porin) [Ectothiorhodospira magna]